MIHQHESFETDAHSRGRTFGRALQQAVRNTVSAYQRLFHEMHGLTPDDLRRRGAVIDEILRTRRPESAREIRGIADGASVDPLILLAINARTEIFAGAGAPECSVLGAALARRDDDRTGPVLAQNWDWHPSAAGSLVLWTVHDGAGGWFATLTEAGILGKIGVNSSGLGVCLNIMAMTDDGGLAGLPIHVVLRLILSDCTNIDEAQRLVEGERYSASTAITVASDDGRFRTFEVSPRGVGVIEGDSGKICHTNHFLTGIGEAVDTIARDGVGSATRLREVSGALGGETTSVAAFKEALRSHAGGASSVCNHDLENPVWADKQQTMASIVIDLKERTLEISDGPPCQAEYVAYRL